MSLVQHWNPIESPGDYSVTRDGVQVTEVCVVTGSTLTNYPAREAEAIDNIGRARGMVLDPGICANCYLEQIHAAPFALGEKEGVAVSYTFAQRLPVKRISLFGACQQMPTSKNKDGTTMYVQQNAQAAATAQVPTPSKYVSAPGIKVTQQEYPTGATVSDKLAVLEARKLAYEGTVNSDTFRGQSARKWLCYEITADSADGGYSYEVSYTFLFNPDTWDEHTFWKDKAGNIPYPTNSSSAKTERLYLETAFSGLPV